MFIWAVFTLGFFFGVFLSLSVFVGKDDLEEKSLVKSDILNFPDNPWENHKKLLRINYTSSGGVFSPGVQRVKNFLLSKRLLYDNS